MSEEPERDTPQQEQKGIEVWFTALGRVLAPIIVGLPRLYKKYPKVMVAASFLLFPGLFGLMLRVGALDMIAGPFADRQIALVKNAVRQVVEDELKPLKDEADATKAQLAAHEVNDSLQKQKPRRRVVMQTHVPGAMAQNGQHP